MNPCPEQKQGQWDWRRKGQMGESNGHNLLTDLKDMGEGGGQERLHRAPRYLPGCECGMMAAPWE